MLLYRLKQLATSLHFVINIGDEGAILTLFQNKKLAKRLYAATANDYDVKQFRKLIELHPKASISVLIDNTDQSYLRQKIPPVNRVFLPRLIRKRMRRDVEPEDFAGAIRLGRSKQGRKDWNYVFVSVPHRPPVSEWMAFLDEFENPIHGYFLLPVELANICNHYVKTTKKQRPVQHHWKLMVVHNKISGLRQVVLDKNKIIFTRVTNTTQEDIPEVVAGEIEHELINTIDYIKRITGDDHTEVSIVMSLESSIMHHINLPRLQCKDIHMLTPYQMAEHLKIENACKETDKFCDTLVAAHFAHYAHSDKIHTKKTQRFNQLLFAHKAALLTTIITTVYLVLHVIYNSLSMYTLHEDINYTQQQQEQITATWQSESKALGGYDIGTATQINNIANVYRILSSNAFSPLNSIAQLIPVLSQNMKVNHIYWTLTDPVKKGRGKQKKAEPMVNLTIELTLFNNESGIQNIFSNFDQFIVELESSFKEYTVKYSQLPSTFTFNDENKSIPIKINITGPNTP